MSQGKRRRARNRKLGRPPMNARQISGAHRQYVAQKKLASALATLDFYFPPPHVPTPEQQLAAIEEVFGPE